MISLFCQVKFFTFSRAFSAQSIPSFGSELNFSILSARSRGLSGSKEISGGFEGI